MDFNSKNYWEKNEDEDFVNIIPTSAITGEGMPDLLGFICHLSQTKLREKVTRNLSEFKSTVMEVKKIEGLGMTADLIVVNGILKVNDKIVLSGTQGPIAT